MHCLLEPLAHLLPGLRQLFGAIRESGLLPLELLPEPRHLRSIARWRVEKSLHGPPARVGSGNKVDELEPIVEIATSRTESGHSLVQYLELQQEREGVAVGAARPMAASKGEHETVRVAVVHEQDQAIGLADSTEQAKHVPVPPYWKLDENIPVATEGVVKADGHVEIRLLHEDTKAAHVTLAIQRARNRPDSLAQRRS
jgi:hypothetical protein